MIVLAAAALMVSLAIIVGVIVHGRISWTIGDVRLLRASRLGRPLAVAFLSAVSLLRVLQRKWFDRLATLFSLRSWLFVALLAIVAYAGISGRHILHGDGREYILQTQSLLFDGSLLIRPDAVREYWNRTNPYGDKLTKTRPPANSLSESTQAGGGFGGLYPDRFGNYRYYHFWLYSAVVAPVYLLFHLFDSSGSLEYFAFRFVNVCLLSMFFILAWRQKPSWTVLGILAVLLFSPLIPYCDWQHPEILCLTLVFLAFWLTGTRAAVFISPVLLGLAGSQNLPILMFLPCHLLVALTCLRLQRAGEFAKPAVGYVGGLIAGFSSSIYCLYYFRTPSVIAHIGLASLEYASLTRAFHVFFSPFVGAALFFPLCIFAIPACFTRRNWLILSVALVCVFGATWLASSTANFNAGQVGTVRYAVWLLAPLWYCLVRWGPTKFELTFRGNVFNVALGLSIFLIFYLRTYEMVEKDIRRFSGARRAQPEVAALMRWLPYHDDAETMVENILGRELAHPSQFRDAYLWDLGHDRYLWILSERALSRQRPLIFETDNHSLVSFKMDPAQPVQLTQQGNIARVQLYDPSPRMRAHPVLGRYLLMRSEGRITKVLANQPFAIRSDTIEQVDSIG